MLFTQLDILNQKLLQIPSLRQRLAFLDEALLGDEFFSCRSFYESLGVCTLEEQWLLKQLMAIGQAGRVGRRDVSFLRSLCKQLQPVDQFYRELGGIIGYQVEVLKKLSGSLHPFFEGASFHSPYFHDISKPSLEVDDAISCGIEALSATAEFYPLGGAADRLHLVDPMTGGDLPAAKMTFAGRTLFEGLIRDVLAREKLYEEKFRKKIVMPIAIMTSPEKDNHRYILEMCESNEWFGRPKDSFRLFCQPLVPAVNEKGDWLWLDDERLLMKPGGHGALWKMARDEGVFSWLKNQDIKQVMVRQVNNPLAGVDSGLLAFLGLGVKHQMAFGFVSCPRLLKTAEGVNVLVEKKKGDLVQRVLTNIEYCDFVRYSIEDKPLIEGGLYSGFTCNTNILFARLQEIEKAVEQSPYPGLLINIKPATISSLNGEKKQILMGRLESTMQNIADVFIEEHSIQSEPKTKRTFVMYNERRKTISTTKRAYVAGGSLQETPEQGFYDLLQASRELLISHCGYHLPPVRSLLETEELGPDCVFLYNPALGPLYSLIAQRIKRGRMALGSELEIELAGAFLEDLDLEGSFRILAEKPLESRCILKKVSVRNQGVNWKASRPYWAYQLTRKESMQIILKGSSEFIAEDVLFSGSQEWIVEDGVRMIVAKDGSVRKEKAQGQGPWALGLKNLNRA